MTNKKIKREVKRDLKNKYFSGDGDKRMVKSKLQFYSLNLDKNIGQELLKQRSMFFEILKYIQKVRL